MKNYSIYPNSELEMKWGDSQDFWPFNAIEQQLKSAITNSELHELPLFQYENKNVYFENIRDKGSFFANLNDEWQNEFERLQKLDAFIVAAKQYSLKCNNYSRRFKDFWIPFYNHRTEITRELHNKNKNNQEYKILLRDYNKVVDNFESRVKSLEKFLDNIVSFEWNIEDEMIGTESPKFAFLYSSYQGEINKRGEFKSIQKIVENVKEEVYKNQPRKKDIYALQNKKRCEKFAKELMHSLELELIEAIKDIVYVNPDITIEDFAQAYLNLVNSFNRNAGILLLQEINKCKIGVNKKNLKEILHSPRVIDEEWTHKLVIMYKHKERIVSEDIVEGLTPYKKH